MKQIVILVFLILSSNLFSQELVSLNPDGKSIDINANSYAWFDASEQEISKEAFQDSLKTLKYVLDIIPKNDRAEFHLRNKFPEISKIVGKKLPASTYKDINGNSVDINENKNISLLNFWNIHCGPCIKELMVFNIIAKEYPDMDIYAITSDRVDDVKNFMDKHQLKWDNIIIIPEYKQDYVSLLKIDFYPMSVIVGKNRIIKGVFFGGGIRQVLAAIEMLDNKI